MGWCQGMDMAGLVFLNPRQLGRVSYWFDPCLPLPMGCGRMLLQLLSRHQFRLHVDSQVLPAPLLSCCPAGCPTTTPRTCGSTCIDPTKQCCRTNSTAGLACGAGTVCSGDGGPCDLIISKQPLAWWAPSAAPWSGFLGSPHLHPRHTITPTCW